MAQTQIEHIQSGVDSLEIGDFKNGRVKISFSPEESQDEERAVAHIDRMARLRARAAAKLSGKTLTGEEK